MHTVRTHYSQKLGTFLQSLLATSQHYMGLIDIIKPPSTVLNSAVNKSKQHQEKNAWERRELNPGLLGENQVCYLCAMPQKIANFL